MKLLEKNPLGGLLALVISGLLLGLVQLSQAEQASRVYGLQGRLQQGAENVNHVPVRVMEIAGTAALGGAVIPFQEVTLAAQMPGRIEYIAGIEGNWFQKDTELVRIDDDDLLAQQRSAFAELENAYLTMRNAGVQYNRELWAPQSRSINRIPGMGMPALFDQMFTRNFGSMAGFGSPNVDRYSDLYAQGTQLDQSRSRVTQAQSRLDEIAARLRDSRSVAPFDGVIAHKLVEVGDTVQPGQHLMMFSNLEYLQVKVDVPSRLMQGLMETEFVAVRLDDADKTVTKGRIAQKYPIADPERYTVTVKIDLKKDVPALPGMYAEVMIPESNSRKKKQIVIPGRAIANKRRGSMPAVYVWNEERKRKERRYVRLGTQIDSEHISVLSGLSEGDTLVIDDWR